MLRTRPVWMRGLRLYRSMASAGPLDGIAVADDLFDARVHARSRFRSEDDLTRFAVYTVHDAKAWAPPTPVSEPGDHTLIAVREVRRRPRGRSPSSRSTGPGKAASHASCRARLRMSRPPPS